MTGFSVPKKKFPSSVGRHRVRRLMVEAWRLHKHDLYAIIPSGIQIHMFFLFTDKKLPQYQDVEQAIIKCIEKLKDLPLTEKEESKNIKNIGPA